MRFHGAHGPACLLPFLLAPVFLNAQFQEPTKEELQMTSDSRAVGSPYVYLYREDITDQPANTHTTYERIKVLTEKGKDAATVRVRWVPKEEKLPEIEGRTIHADGAVIPLAVKPSDLVDLKTKSFQIDTVVFTLPDAQVGSILEYRIKERFESFVAAPAWMIQQEVLVHKAHYVFKTYPNARMSYTARLAQGIAVGFDKKNTFTLDLDEVPALPSDDWMPPLNSFKWRVYFFRSFFASRSAYWDTAAKNWGQAIAVAVNPTGTIKKAAAQLVDSGDSETRKTRKIYEAVMKMENTDYERQKTMAERRKEKIKDILTLDDVWKQQRGTSDDLALLFVALCRAAGLSVDPMRVVDRSRAWFEESILSDEQLDDYIAVARLEGKDIYLDPGEKLCPFGLLHWAHTFTSGFRLNGKAGALVRTPALGPSSSTLDRAANLEIDENGTLRGSIRYVLTGEEALYWRQLTLENDEGEVKKQFTEDVHASLPAGVETEFDHFIGLGNYESNLVAVVRVSGTLGTATGKRYFLPGLFFESNSRHPFVSQQNRTIPVDARYASIVSDEVTYVLPGDDAVESVPQTADLAWADFAHLQIGATKRGSSVNVTHVFTRGFAILQPDKYADLHDFYRKAAEADQQQIVLTRSPAAAGK